MWKRYSADTYTPRDPFPVSQPARQPGAVVALVGKVENGNHSRSRKKEHLERIPRITDDLFGYNVDGKLLLLRFEKKDRKYDKFAALPFTKGVTERESGRTMLILGSNAHHIEAMQGQFNGVVWTPGEVNENKKKYGDTIRWINVGGTREGFVGLDYDPNLKKDDGVATTADDISFLAKTLMEYGYDPDKRLYLLTPPYIVESPAGKERRARGFNTLRDWAEKK